MTNTLYENFSGNTSVNMFNCVFGKNFCILKNIIIGYPIYCKNNYVNNKYETVYNNIEEGSVDCNIYNLLKNRIYNIYIHNPGNNGHIYLIFDSNIYTEFSNAIINLYINTNAGYIHFVNNEKEDIYVAGSINPLLGESMAKSFSLMLNTKDTPKIFSSLLFQNGKTTLDNYIFNEGSINYDITNKRCELVIDNNKRVHLDGNSLDRSGTSYNRPAENINIGFQYYDTTLNKPIWWTGEKWVDATGAEV